MLRVRAAAAAVALGLLLGILAGWFDAQDRFSVGARSELVLPCFKADEADTSLRLTLSRASRQALQLTTTASATVRGIDPGWAAAVDLPYLADCLIVNHSSYKIDEEGPEYLTGPGIVGFATYDYDRRSSSLQVDFGERRIDYEFGSRAQSSIYLTQPAVVAYHDGRDLVISANPCPPESGRLGCSGAGSGTFTLVVPAELVTDDLDGVSLRPLPTSRAISNGDAVLTWTSETPNPIIVRLPLSADIAIQDYFSRGGTVAIQVPSAVLRLSPVGALYLPVLIVLLVGAAVVRSDSGSSIGRSGFWRLILLYLILAVLPQIHIEPLSDHSVAQSLDLAKDSVIWASIWLMAAWSVRAAIGALAGVIAVGFGIFVEQEVVLVGALLVLLIGGLQAIGRRLADAVLILPASADQLLSSRIAKWPARLRPAILSVSLFSILMGLGALVGTVLGTEAQSSHGGLSVQFAVVLVAGNATHVLSAVAGILVIGAFAKVVTHESRPAPGSRMRVSLAYLFSVLVPPTAVVWAGIGLPVWLITLMLLLVLLRTTQGPVGTAEEAADDADEADGESRDSYVTNSPRARDFLAQALDREMHLNQIALIDAQVSAGEAPMARLRAAREAARRRHPTDETKLFLNAGVHNEWLKNAQLGAWVGGILGLLPLAGFVWGAFQSAPARVGYNGVLYLSVGIASEYARWIVSAFVVGALYTRIPGRLGAVKGAVLAAFWTLSALAAELISRWITGASSDNWLFLSLQMFLFLVATGVAIDALTINAAGGTFRRLTDIYRISTLRRQFAYLGPLLLAVVALIQQVSAGANEEVAKEVINSISRVLGG